MVKTKTMIKKYVSTFPCCVSVLSLREQCVVWLQYSTQFSEPPWGCFCSEWGPVPPDWSRSSNWAVSSQQTPAPSSWLPPRPSAEKPNQHPCLTAVQKKKKNTTHTLVFPASCPTSPQTKLSAFQVTLEWSEPVVITFLQAVCLSPLFTVVFSSSS